MKLDRKNSPKMVVRPHFVTDYQRLERQSYNRERFIYTMALLSLFVFIVVAAKLVQR